MKREEELTVSEQLAEALDHIKRLIVALKPFSDFAINVEFDGDLNTNAWKSRIHRESISTWFGPSDFAYAAFSVGDTSARLSSLAAPKMETVWIQNLKGFINGVFPSDDRWKRIFIDQLERIDQAPAPKPKPVPVGWETEAEWDLEMRCCNITENTPFAEVSKLINDLWQQYCLAAEPKGIAHQVHHSKPIVSQNTQIVEDKTTEGGAHEKAVDAAIAACPMNYFVRERMDDQRSQLYRCGINSDDFEIMLAAYRAALTAKQTDGREG